MSDWIKANEKTPEKSGLVLTCMEETNDLFIAFYRKNRNVFEVYGSSRTPITDMKVAYWQPLPEPPNN